MIKKICCIGAGYVGGPTMSVISKYCPEIDVYVVDSNEERIRLWNSNDLNDIPVKEPGLSEMISEVRGKNLFFTTQVDKYIHESEMIFIAVNTPTKQKGEGKGMASDLSNVISCVKQIAKSSSTNKIIVEKSTIPVKTAEKITEVLNIHKQANVKFEIISNPEFLAEGTAINDLINADRVLIGAHQTKNGIKAQDQLMDIYKKWIPENKIIKTNVWSSELSKLASNAFLAQRISSINSLSEIAEKTGAKIDELSTAIGMDNRIGDKFLKSSVGFGGSCFQKDILNLVYISRQYGLDEVADYWLNVIKINEYQRDRFFKKIIDNINNIDSKIISILGWAFKKNTNDSRESSSISIVSKLLIEGVKIKIYDPVIKKNQILEDLKTYFEFKSYNQNSISRFLENIIICDQIDDCISDTNGIAVLTEWDEFLKIQWDKYSISNHSKIKPNIFDGRGILDLEALNTLGYKVFQIGNGENTII